MAYVPYDPNRPNKKPKDLNAQDIDTYKDAEAAKDRFAKQVKGAKADLSAFDVSPYSQKRAMPSTRQPLVSATPKPAVLPPIPQRKTDMATSTTISAKAPVDNSGPKGAASTADSGAGTAFAKQYADNKIAQGLKDLAVTETRTRGNDKYKNAHDFSGDTSLDTSNPKTAPTATATSKPKPAAKSAPKAKSQFEKMQDAYTGFGKGSDSTANKAIQSRIEGKGVAKTPAMKKGGKVKPKCFAKGGSVKSSASSRGDGCATKGHTRGVMR